MLQYIKTRYKFLTISFLAGFLFIYIASRDLPSALLAGIVLSITSGNITFYIFKEKLGYIEAAFRSLKYLVVLFILLVIISISTYQP